MKVIGQCQHTKGMTRSKMFIGRFWAIVTIPLTKHWTELFWTQVRILNLSYLQSVMTTDSCLLEMPHLMRKLHAEIIHFPAALSQKLEKHIESIWGLCEVLEAPPDPDKLTLHLPASWSISFQIEINSEVLIHSGVIDVSVFYSWGWGRLKGKVNLTPPCFLINIISNQNVSDVICRTL